MKRSVFLVDRQSASRPRAGLVMAAALSVMLLLPLCAGAGAIDAEKCEGAIALTEADNGGTVDVALNGTFTLRLASHSDGGYQWVVTALNTAKLRMLSRAVDTSGCPEGATGCSGDDIFTFKAIGTGESALLLQSQRSWEPANPAALFSVTVKVAPEAQAEGEANCGIALTEEDNGKTITVTVNETFTARLHSGADGGYQWVVTAMDAAVLENPEHTVDTSMCAPGIMGCSGDDIFTFKAVGAGQTTLSLESRRSWDPENPGSTFSVTVIVVPEDDDENGCERFLDCVGGTIGTANPPAGPGGDAALLGATVLLFMVLGRKRSARCAVR